MDLNCTSQKSPGKGTNYDLHPLLPRYLPTAMQKMQGYISLQDVWNFLNIFETLQLGNDVE